MDGREVEKLVGIRRETVEPEADGSKTEEPAPGVEEPAKKEESAD